MFTVGCFLSWILHRRLKHTTTRLATETWKEECHFSEIAWVLTIYSMSALFDLLWIPKMKGNKLSQISYPQGYIICEILRKFSYPVIIELKII